MVPQFNFPPLEVGFKRIEFEDGHFAEVQPFTICQRGVCIGEFRSFCDASGYISDAEKRKNNNTYLNNPCTRSARCRTVKEFELLPAVVLTFSDATAFSNFYEGIRLPTEEEWLAFALVTDEILPFPDLENKGWEFMRKLEKERPEYNIIAFSDEWTSTREGGGVVCRRGPCIYRASNWREKIQQNRTIASEDELCDGRSFRLVLS